MKKAYIFSILAIACGFTVPQASAQRFAVKAYGDVGLGKAMSLTTALPGLTSKSSSYSFGVDFGYTFWRQGGNSLEANIGLGYRMATANFDLGSLSFNYAAPASADEDGNPYQRYTTLTDVKQKLSLGYVNLPIYLQYQYRITDWLGVHADAGFGLGFRCAGSAEKVTGNADTYGVYPGYDDLVIKADYLNDFGEHSLRDAIVGETEMKGFAASVMCGAGVEFYIADPVSLDLGIRYNAGLTDVFAGRYEITDVKEITAESAPVTYTVAEGQQAKPLSDYVTKSRLSPLSLHLAINIRF